MAVDFDNGSINLPLQLPLHLPWQNNKQSLNVTAMLSPYLFDNYSLTAALKNAREQFSVQVLNNQQFPAPHFLAASFNEVQPLWCREVLLQCDGQNTVFAQSWLNPAACHIGMDTIGETPLGEILFTDHSWQRGELEFFEITGEALQQLAEHIGENLHWQHGVWARRSWFKNGAAKILVCEVFIAKQFYDD